MLSHQEIADFAKKYCDENDCDHLSSNALIRYVTKTTDHHADEVKKHIIEILKNGPSAEISEHFIIVLRRPNPEKLDASRFNFVLKHSQ